MAPTPRSLNSQHLYAETLLRYLPGRHRWLDLGCGHGFLPPWMEGRGPDRQLASALDSVDVVGIDMDRLALTRHPNLAQRIVANIEHLPIADTTFDLVTANMVMEHVEDPARVFREVRRVLAPGGMFIVHTPNVLGYTTVLARCVPSGLRPWVASALQGRKENDVYRTHYRVNTVANLREAAAREAFKIADLQTVSSSPQFFRVPVVRSLETRLLAALAHDRLAAWRPCIIGCFARSGS